VDTLESIIDTLTNASPEIREKMIAMAAGVQDRWVPNPGPQTDAYFSEADCLLYGGAPGGGKGLDLQTLIPSPNGFIPMGELQVGDVIFDKDGAQCRVVFKSAIHNRRCFEITFSDGTKVVADDEHQWLVRSRRERQRAWGSSNERRATRRATRAKRGTGKRPDLALRNSATAKTSNLPLEGVRRTDALIDDVRVGVDNRINYSVDMAKPLQTDMIDLLIDPYVLGAWLGDGSTSSGAMTGIDEDIFLNVANAGYIVTRHADPISRGVLGLKVQLRQLGVLGNKHIPPTYLRADVSQRLALLQGLMDTDGHCDRRGQCEIQLTCRALIDGVHELLSSLGIKAQMHEGDAKLNGRVTSKKWRLKFLTDLPAFKLPRKLIRQKRAGFRGTHNVRFITDITEVTSRPTQCIQVDSPRSTYLCGEAMIPTHNTNLILGLAFNQHKRSMILRRQYTDLDRITADAIAIHGSRVGFNGSSPPKLRISDSQVISFRAAAKIGDEQGTMGQGRDLLCVGKGTPVLMASGEYKPIESLRQGDVLRTLGGSHRVTKVHPVQRKESVMVSVVGKDGAVIATQIQSKNHRLLLAPTTLGWERRDKSGVSHPSSSCVSRQTHSAWRSPLSFECLCAVWRRIVELKDVYPRRAFEWLQFALLWRLPHLSVIGACAVPQDQESVSVGSCVSSPRKWLHSLPNGLLGPSLRLPEMGGVVRNTLRRVSWNEVDDAPSLSSLASSQGHCLEGHYPCDGLPLFRPTFGSGGEGDQLCLLRLNDAGQPTPSDLQDGDMGNTPRYTSHKGLYIHPYRSDVCCSNEPLEAFSFFTKSVGVRNLYDIEVEDVNHYITYGGVVNSNCIDEATQFAESQIRFMMGWVRSEDPDQRCRTVLATNPPLTPEGLWVVKMFAPWLDPRYPNHAEPGELRWIISDEDGKDLWVEGPDDARMILGKMRRPTSRTYIPSSVRDNPFYAGTSYEDTLDGMSEPFRSLLLGGFRTEFKDVKNQIMPTQWVIAAQQRWTATPPDGVPMCSIGVDCTGGGADPLVMAPRYDGWFAPLKRIEGKDIPLETIGSTTVGHIMQVRKGLAKVVLDMGGGYGGPAYEHLKDNEIPTIAYRGSEGSRARTRDRQYGFTNKRTEALWRFREALDPDKESGSPIMLPTNHPNLVADLTAATFEVVNGKIKAETKESVCSLLGRSTDEGDAVIMAWSGGDTLSNRKGGDWNRKHKIPKVVMSHQAKRRH